jgi:hypothetical protein
MFATTHWSVVLEAQGESAAAQKALEKLCRTYWRSIYGYVRRYGAGTQDAENLAQSFFALLLERERGQTRLLQVSSALPNIVARGDRPHRRHGWRCRRRIAPSDRCSSGIRSKRI